MNVKGTFYITTKNAMKSVFGEEHWNSFMARAVEKDTYFGKMIMSITLIPVEKSIIFLKRCLKNSSTTTAINT